MSSDKPLILSVYVFIFIIGIYILFTLGLSDFESFLTTSLVMGLVLTVSILYVAESDLKFLFSDLDENLDEYSKYRCARYISSLERNLRILNSSGGKHVIFTAAFCSLVTTFVFAVTSQYSSLFYVISLIISFILFLLSFIFSFSIFTRGSNLYINDSFILMSDCNGCINKIKIEDVENVQTSFLRLYIKHPKGDKKFWTYRPEKVESQIIANRI